MARTHRQRQRQRRIRRIDPNPNLMQTLDLGPAPLSEESREAPSDFRDPRNGYLSSLRTYELSAARESELKAPVVAHRRRAKAAAQK